MAELLPKTPCDGLLPLTCGNVTLSECVPQRITALMPYAGQTAALSDALMAAHGVAFPAPGRMTAQKGASMVWTGLDQAMLLGPEPAVDLAALAAIVDQSDAWAMVQLDGAGAEHVLARLVPLDLRISVFKQGHTARSLLGHMNVSITRTDTQAFRIMAFRSMAATLVHDLHTAMSSVGARSQA